MFEVLGFGGRRAMSIESSTADCLSRECTVTTFVGSGVTLRTDGVGTAAGLFTPMALSLSKLSNSILFIENAGTVRRVYLPSSPEIRASIVQSVSAGLAEAATSLAVISPLIELIVSYAISDGMLHTKRRCPHN